jgi:hypothetical protein
VVCRCRGNWTAEAVQFSVGFTVPSYRNTESKAAFTSYKRWLRIQDKLKLYISRRNRTVQQQAVACVQACFEFPGRQPQWTLKQTDARSTTPRERWNWRL